MKIIRLALSMTGMLLSNFMLHAQSWTLAGPDATDQPGTFTTIADIASDKAGGMYYACKDPLSNKASVRKWDGAHWQQVGAASFSGGAVDYLNTAVSPTGVPYVVYKDYSATGKATVMTFNGSSWVNVGGPVSSGGANCTFIAIDNAGVPYVAYADSLLNKKVTVKKWDGSAWQTVGNAGFAPSAVADLKIKLNSTGQPYVLVQYYAGSNGISEVYQYNGTAWASLGIAGQTSISYPDRSADLAISSGDMPMVAFADNSMSRRVTVKQFDGTAWVNMGASGFSPAAAAGIQLRIDALNGPYLSCLSNFNPGSSETLYPMIRHFNGTIWEVTGPDSFITRNTVAMPAFDLDTAHVPYLMDIDYYDYSKVLLRKLDGTQWKILGTSEGLAKAPASLSVAAASPDGSKAYSASSNFYTNFTPSRVCRFDDTAWTVIGESSPSSWRGAVTDIAVHPDGHPWIVVMDTVPFSSEYSVWRHTDTGWVNTQINLTTLGGQESLCFDGAGNAYFANMPYVGQMFIKKYTQGLGWSTLNGSPTPINTTVDYLRIKVNHAGVPHVLAGVHYSSSGPEYGFGIYAYNGTSWPTATSSVSSNFGAPAGSTPDFAFDTADVIHIAFLNNSQPAIAVRKFNAVSNSFTNVVPPAGVPVGSKPGIQFAPDGSLYLCYTENNSGYYYGGATVKRLVGNAWQTVGASSFTVGTPYYPQLLLLNNRLMTTVSDGATFAYQYNCATPVTITQAPRDTVVCDGVNAAFTTAANGASGYRWQMNSGQGWNNVPADATYSGVNSATLLVTAATAAMDGTQFRCVYANTCGVPAISTAARLLIEVPGAPAPAVSIAADRPVACEGAAVSFRATITQPGAWHTYEWLLNGTPVAGAEDSVFLTSALNSSDVVTCRYTRLSACGSAPATATSNAMSITILPAAAPSVTITAAPGTTVPAGQSITFTAAVTNGGLAPQYQWLRNNAAVAAATAASFTTSLLNNGDAITVRVTRSDTCATAQTALSQPLTVEVTTGIGEVSKQYGFRVYPQPARDQVTLSATSGMPAGVYQLSLFSITGQLLISEQIKVSGQAWVHRLALPSSIQAGLYRITLQHPALTLGSMLTIIR